MTNANTSHLISALSLSLSLTDTHTHLSGGRPEQVVHLQERLLEAEPEVTLLEGVGGLHHVADVRGAVLGHLRAPLERRYRRCMQAARDGSQQSVRVLFFFQT